MRTPDARWEPLGVGLVLNSTVPPAPPLFRWMLAVRGVHSPSRIFERKEPLTAANTFTAALRGRYQVTAWWELADYFGFTRLVPARRWTATLTVEPSGLPFSPPRPPATRTGRWRPRRTGARAGDPFDVRVYSPGDDLRRLHWPLYAHSGVPFVRTAEPSPPPSGHQRIVLDTAATSEDDLDVRLGQLVTWLASLDRQNTPWTLAVPSVGVQLSHGAWATLAGLSPAPLPPRWVSPWKDAVVFRGGPAAAVRPLRPWWKRP